MKIIRTKGQYSPLGKYFRYEQFPWFRLSIRAIVGLFGVIGFTFPETILASAADSSSSIRVRVNNYAQASPATLGDLPRSRRRRA